MPNPGRYRRQERDDRAEASGGGSAAGGAAGGTSAGGTSAGSVPYAWLRDVPVLGETVFDPILGITRDEEEAARKAAEAKQDAAWDDLSGHYADPDYLNTLLEEDVYSGVEADPQAVDAQRLALDRLSSVVDQGGLTAIDRARIAQAQAQERSVEQGQRQAIQQQMAARGMGGSGSDMMSQLMAQQGSANRMNQAGLDIEGMAQERALAAMGQLGNQAQQMRGQSFGEGSWRAGQVGQMNARNRAWQREVPSVVWGQHRDVAQGRSGVAGQQAQSAQHRYDKAPTLMGLADRGIAAYGAVSGSGGYRGYRDRDDDR